MVDIPARAAFLILGMHRSGTSALTLMLQRLGAELPKTQIAPNAENPKGFGESTVFARFHDRMLESAGTNWRDWSRFNADWKHSIAAPPMREEMGQLFESEFGGARLVAFKDPRICRFPDIWLEYFAQTRTACYPILPFRSPVEVAASLTERNKFSTVHGELLWLRHVIDAESATRGRPRCVVNYQDTIEDWRTVVASMREHLGVRWPRYSPIVEYEIDNLIDRKLHRQVATVDNGRSRGPAARWVNPVYEALLEMSKRGESAKTHSIFDQVAREFDEASAIFASLTRDYEMKAARATGASQKSATEAAASADRVAIAEARISELTKQVDETQSQLRTANDRIKILDSRVPAPATSRP